MPLAQKSPSRLWRLFASAALQDAQSFPKLPGFCPSNVAIAPFSSRNGLDQESGSFLGLRTRYCCYAFLLVIHGGSLFPLRLYAT